MIYNKPEFNFIAFLFDCKNSFNSTSSIGKLKAYNKDWVIYTV